LEGNRSEANRILEVIKVGDPDKAAVDLQFLVDAGLLGEATSKRITEYLSKKKPAKERLSLQTVSQRQT
jgi:hypothetical protein